jgi:hypothetical protein
VHWETGFLVYQVLFFPYSLRCWDYDPGGSSKVYCFSSWFGYRVAIMGRWSLQRWLICSACILGMLVTILSLMAWPHFMAYAHLHGGVQTLLENTLIMSVVHREMRLSCETAVGKLTSRSGKEMGHVLDPSTTGLHQIHRDLKRNPSMFLIWSLCTVAILTEQREGCCQPWWPRSLVFHVCSVCFSLLLVGLPSSSANAS